MKEKMQLSESLEDYLEVILELEKINKVARAKDIAKKLNVQRGSVTGSLKNLGEKGLINYEPYSFITLTEKGARIAKRIKKRHTILKDFLTQILQIDEKNAEKTACRMEHVINEHSFKRLVRFFDFVNQCPRTSSDWLNLFEKSCGDKKPTWGKCNKCIDKCKARHQKAEPSDPTKQAS